MVNIINMNLVLPTNLIIINSWEQGFILDIDIRSSRHFCRKKFVDLVIQFFVKHLSNSIKKVPCETIFQIFKQSKSYRMAEYFQHILITDF